MTNIDQSKIRNRLLASLPAAEYTLVSAALERVTLELGQTLHRSGEVIDYTYFVETGFISAMAVLSEGLPLEVGLIGSEGAAGAPVLLGAKTSYCETMCQTGGEALRISAAKLVSLSETCPVLRTETLKYLQIFHAQVIQTAACNAHHDLSQRLARWLLSAQDRSGVPELSLTAIHRQRCGIDPSARRHHPLPAWPDHHHRPRWPRECGLRMLRSHSRRVSPPVRRGP
jgi:CRP-like cAMP-binding protein